MKHKYKKKCTLQNALFDRFRSFIMPPECQRRTAGKNRLEETRRASHH